MKLTNQSTIIAANEPSEDWTSLIGSADALEPVSMDGDADIFMYAENLSEVVENGVHLLRSYWDRKLQSDPDDEVAQIIKNTTEQQLTIIAWPWLREEAEEMGLLEETLANPRSRYVQNMDAEVAKYSQE
jgi:hypothetical protein